MIIVTDKGAYDYMQKWTMFALFGISCLLAVGIMLFGMPKPEVEEAAPDGMELVRIEARNDFTFDKEEYVVKAGEPVLLRLVNASGIHGAAIEGTDIDLKDGQMEQEYTFNEPGRYEVICSIMCGSGHNDMVSYIVVE